MIEFPLSEYFIGYTACGALAGLVAASVFAMLGGRSGKWKRRFIASFIISADVWVSSILMHVFSFWSLLLYPLCFGQFSLGYGETGPIPKPVKRLIVVLTSCLCGLIFCLVFGGNTWWALLLQFIVGSGTVMFAMKNPFHAAAEEALVCFLNNIIVVMYPFLYRTGVA